MADQGGHQSGLAKYNAKRDFSKTAEPEGKVAKKGGYRYLIQKHAATRLHYDFRLELDGVLKSWAVTRGPSFNPADKRLAVETEDHPVSYGDFEGTIPKGEYGGGTVMLWDQGTWEPVGDPHEGLEKGDLKFRLHGERLSGEWVLARMRSRPEDRGRSNWLLIKHRDDVSNEDDAEAWLETQGKSIVSGRIMDEIAKGDKQWHAGHAEKKPKPKATGSKKKPASLSQNRSGHLTFIEPELATLADAMPSGVNWVHELKFDGYRVQVLIDADGVRLLTRKGLDWSHRFAPLPRLFDRLDVSSAIIDGEIVAAEPDGSHSFRALQAVLGKEKSDAPLQYYAFDLLHLNGEDLTRLPLIERKARLQALLKDAALDGRIIYSEHFTDRNDAFLNQICGLGMEGLISKRADAPYARGRGKAWLKSKCHKRQEVVIGGFTEPTHAHRGIGALLMGYYDNGEFIYAGKCGTGFTVDTAMDLRKRLDPLTLETSKTGAFAAVPPEVRREARYVTPKLVCEIAFTEWTPDGRLRHPSFQGLREDKPAKEVGRDIPIHTETVERAPAGRRIVTKTKTKGADVGGITITHPERIVYPADDVTKLDVAEYYHAVANHILPHIVNRPISMIRCPEGIGDQCFFQRHLGQGRIDHVHDTGIEVNGRNQEYVMIDDIRGLISLAQWGVMEIHPWGCKAYEPDLPDRMIFDLDPDPEATWKDVTDGAAEVRQRMKEFGLKSFLKTTGGKGLHVVVPIKPKFHWDAIKAFTRAVAQSMAHDSPDHYIATASKSARKGKIFVDYLRNDHTATAVAAYSLRARPGAPVAMPVEWGDLGADLKPSAFNIRTATEVLKARKHDPWEEIFKLRQTLPAKVLEALNIPAE